VQAVVAASLLKRKPVSKAKYLAPNFPGDEGPDNAKRHFGALTRPHSLLQQLIQPLDLFLVAHGVKVGGITEIVL
jgi:hypothetical protein